MLLAIDTATRFAGLALYDPDSGRVLGEESWYSVNNHTVELMPRLVRHDGAAELSRPADLTGLGYQLWDRALLPACGSDWVWPRDLP